MRVFENKETTIEEPGKDGSLTTLTYYDLVKSVTNKIPREGLVISEQKKRLDVQCLIHDKLKVGEKVEIEEHIYETIKSCTKGFPWYALHKDLCDFEDYITELKEK